MLDLAGKDLAEGVVSVASFAIDASPAAAEFHQKMLAAYKEDPFPITSAQGYDAAHIMFLALAKSGPDPKKLRDAIEQVDNLKARDLGAGEAVQRHPPPLARRQGHVRRDVQERPACQGRLGRRRDAENALHCAPQGPG